MFIDDNAFSLPPGTIHPRRIASSSSTVVVVVVVVGRGCGIFGEFALRRTQLRSSLRHVQDARAHSQSIANLRGAAARSKLSLHRGQEMRDNLSRCFRARSRTFISIERGKGILPKIFELETNDASIYLPRNSRNGRCGRGVLNARDIHRGTEVIVSLSHARNERGDRKGLSASQKFQNPA